VVDSSRTRLEVRPDDADFGSLGLSGFAARAVDDLRELATGSDEDVSRRASDALALLVTLSGRAS